MNQTTRLGDIAQVFNGKTPSKAEKRDEGLPILKIKDVAANGYFKGVFESFVDKEFFEKHKKKKLLTGDTLILNAAHNAGYVGSKQFYACRDVEGVIATGEWLIVRPSPELADTSYVNHWLASGEARFRIRDLVKGIHLYPKDVARLKIPLPPLKEQKRIAAILDKADAIRRKRQQAIDLTDQLLRSVFLGMFGDPGFNPNKYDELRLGELTRRKMNNGIFRKNHEYGGSVPVAWVGELFVGEQIDLTGSRCVEPSKKELKSYGMRYGDILYCRSSLKLGGIGWNNVYLGEDEKALFECHLIRMSPNMNLVNPIFLSYQLRLNNVRKRMFQQAKTVTMTTIDQDGLSNVRVMVPPIEAQNRFADFFIALNDRIQKKDDSLKGADDLFKSLTQSAFRGELTNQTEAA